MEQAKYILKFDEAVLISQKENKGIKFFKISVFIIILIIILGSIVFQENLFLELSWNIRVFLILCVLVVLFKTNKMENVPSLMEIQFYDEYLVVYRPKRYYSKRVTRMEKNRMMYSNIKKCVYKEQSKRIHIYGDVEAVWHNYDSKGVLASVPSYDRVVKDTLCYFSTRCAHDIDFKREIEVNSPIKVIVENS